MQISRRPQNILRAVLMRRLIWNFIHWLAESCRLIRHPGSWLPNTKISLNVVMLHGVLRHIAAGFLPFLIFPLAIESYWISVAINFCLLGGASHFLILNSLLKIGRAHVRTPV